MSRADYAHWNEEADRVWWEEEGRHPKEDDPADDDRDYGAEDAFCEECAERDTEWLIATLCNADYRRRWPKTAPLLLWEIREREGQEWPLHLRP